MQSYSIDYVRRRVSQEKYKRRVTAFSRIRASVKLESNFIYACYTETPAAGNRFGTVTEPRGELTSYLNLLLLRRRYFEQRSNFTDGLNISRVVGLFFNLAPM